MQTTVSYIDAPRAFVEGQQGGGAGAAASCSVPCSPARRRDGIEQPAGGARPASASTAVRGKGARQQAAAVGEVRAVQGITLSADYSLPGSPTHAKPRRWLKFSSSRNARGEGGEAQETDGRGTGGDHIKAGSKASGPDSRRGPTQRAAAAAAGEASFRSAAALTGASSSR